MVLRFVLPLLLLCGVLAWGAAELVRQTVVDWSEQDLAARAQLGAGADELADAEAAWVVRARRLHHGTLALVALFAAACVSGLALTRLYLWRRWTLRVRELMTGPDPPGRYAPALRDLREQVERIARHGIESVDRDRGGSAAGGEDRA